LNAKWSTQNLLSLSLN